MLSDYTTENHSTILYTFIISFETIWSRLYSCYWAPFCIYSQFNLKQYEVDFTRVTEHHSTILYIFTISFETIWSRLYSCHSSHFCIVCWLVSQESPSYYFKWNFEYIFLWGKQRLCQTWIRLGFNKNHIGTLRDSRVYIYTYRHNMSIWRYNFQITDESSNPRQFH
jgi:hypothetical protein